MLDHLAVGPEDLVIGPAFRQRVHSRDLGQDRAHPPGAFGEQGLADRQGQVPQLVVGRGDRDRQDRRVLRPLEGLVAAAAVFQQGIGDQMGQGAELQILLVAATALSRPEISSQGSAIVNWSTRHTESARGSFLSTVAENTSSSMTGGLLEGTQGDAGWTVMILASSPPRNAKPLNSLAPGRAADPPAGLLCPRG